VVQRQLRLREQVGPAIGRESDVARRESGDKVVFGSADGPLCRKGAVILRGGAYWKGRKTERKKAGSEFSGGFVVNSKESKRVR
jgi:hypothetical protein